MATAILMMLRHEIAHRTHRESLRDFAEGVDAACESMKQLRWAL